MRQMFLAQGTKEVKIAVGTGGTVCVQHLPVPEIHEDRLTHARREFYRIFSSPAYSV